MIRLDYGRKTVLTYPDGRTVAYAYDDMDRLIGVKGLDGTKTTYAYDAAGRRTETKGSNLTTTYAYDAIGNLTRQQTTGKTSLSLEYLYDLNNRMTSETRTESGETVKSTYIYDKLGQLAAFTKSDGYAESYAYDAAGNMLQKTVNRQKIAMTYDAANELKTMTGTGGTVNYAYDANGNLTQKTMAAYTDTYAYNVKNQLTSYKGYDGYQQRYSYNAQGHMSKRESKGSASRKTLEALAAGNGEAATAEDGGSDDDPDPYANASSSESWSTTTYVYDVTAPYYEVLSETTDDVTTAYEYGVERISAYEKIGWSTLKTEYVYDGRGSVVQELHYNSSWYTLSGFLSTKGAKKYTYTPFGELLTGEGSGFRFNGEYYDSATGMLNLRARQYEPSVMRFVQRDIIRGLTTTPLTQNRYAYCLNNPILFTDPSGEFVIAALLIGAAIGAIIGGVSSYKAQKAATGKVDGWQVAKNALIGGVVGAVAGVVGAAVAGALATAVGATTLTTAGVSTTLTLMQSVGVASVSAVSAGVASRATNAMVRNSFTDEPKRDVVKEAFDPKAMLTDGIIGGFFGGVMHYATGGIVSSTSIDSRYGGSTTPTSTKPTQSGKPSGSTSGDNPLDDAARDASGEYAGAQYGGATQGESAGSTVCTETGSTSITRVGRWMSIDEYKAMQSTGKVQMSPEGNTTYVANPADPNAFRGAPTGSVYVEFDVPTSSVKAAGNSIWGQIPGPGSNLDKYEQILKGAQPIIEMPDAMNIQLIGGK